MLNVRTREETPPTVILDGLKDFPSVGGTSEGVETGLTDRVATAGVTLLPTLVCNAPAAIELT